MTRTAAERDSTGRRSLLVTGTLGSGSMYLNSGGPGRGAQPAIGLACAAGAGPRQFWELGSLGVSVGAYGTMQQQPTRQK
jgi:hypothetical protein